MMLLLFVTVIGGTGCGGGGTSSNFADNEPEPIPQHTTYTVTFDSNGGSTVASQSVVEGYKAIEPTAPTKSGYTFGGWYSDAGLTLRFSFNTPITANITLYARWNAPSVTTYTVTFNSNGGSEVPSQNVVAGEQAVEPAAPTREGYSFAGWYSDSALTESFNFGTAITGSITLYARWEAQSTPTNSFTVTFASNGGTAVPSQTVEAGGTVVRPDNPEKDGNIFVSWYRYNNDFTNMFLFGPDGDQITEDTTLYAQWLEYNPDLSKVQYAISKISISYSNGDNSAHVTKNLTLQTSFRDESLSGVTVTWSSNNASVIGVDGTVRRPQNDTKVKLTATIYSGSTSQSKEFEVNVIHANTIANSIIMKNNHNV